MGNLVGPQATREYLARMRERYEKADKAERSRLLDEVCEVTGYHRKAAIRRLRRPAQRRVRRPGRPRRYGPTVVRALRQIWEAAGYPWSVRLQALLPIWLPWAIRRGRLPADVAARLRTMSPRQMDRVLQPFKKDLRKRQYGRTRPGTLLKHQIPLKTDRWDVQTPGFTEIDLVAHSGDRADGEFLHSLNVTDIHTTWVETRAVMGKSQHHVQEALEQMRQQLPFRLQGIDSDNGSEFINYHLHRYCTTRDIQFTRGRPYKKDDNAHIEQKNWTHVRKLLGYVRYDSAAALTAINALYDELRLLQNLFLPSVKLIAKHRVGARLQRRYDPPRTPLERVEACAAHADATTLRILKDLRVRLDPFELAQRIDRQLVEIYRLANHRVSPAAPTHPRRVDAAGPVDAHPAPTRSLENRTERGFPQRPPAASTSTPSVTRIVARRSATR
jgi:hypothetical protein